MRAIESSCRICAASASRRSRRRSSDTACSIWSATCSAFSTPWVQRAHVVGHDWGAALAWAMGAFVPDRVDHLAALSVGHPSSFASAGFEQRQKSWYFLFFQFERIAEQWLSGDDWANMRAWAQHPDIDQVAIDLARPGALTAALNWYRANVHPRTWIEPE